MAKKKKTKKIATAMPMKGSMPKTTAGMTTMMKQHMK